MQTKQKHSPNWKKIRTEYEAGSQPIRGIARDYGVSDTAIRKRAKKEGWAPFGSVQIAVGSQAKGPVSNLPSIPEIVVRAASDGVSPDDLAKDLDRRLMDELDSMTSHIGEMEELVQLAMKGEPAAIRSAAMRAISHATRTMSYKNLGLARKAYAESAPGKKEQAQKAAETAGVGTDWGDDLNVAAARAN